MTVPPVTPFTVGPRLLNHDSVVAALRAAYELAGEGTGGRVVVWLQIDTLGQVTEVRLAKRSRLPGLEEQVVGLGYTLRFDPARGGAGAPVPVWVQLPVDFHAGDPSPVRLDTAAWHIPRFVGFARAPQPASPVRAESLWQATVTPVTDRGARGTVVLDVWIGESGKVLAAQVSRPSGRPELDDAVRRWVGVMRFTPPVDSGGQPIDAWVRLPIQIGGAAPPP